MMIVRPALLIASALCLLALPVRAQTTTAAAGIPSDPAAIGTITEVEGAATLTRGNQPPVAATLDMPIHLNDIIETGDGAKADVLFVDDTEVTLGEKAQLAIDTYVYDPANTAANKGRFSIVRGAFLFVSGLMDKNGHPDVKIATPYGAIGLRGTTVWGGDTDDDYGVFVRDGAVDVVNDAGKTEVNAGQGTGLTGRNRAPSAPHPWAADKINRAFGIVHLRNEAAVRECVAQRKQTFAAWRANRQNKRIHRAPSQHSWRQRRAAAANPQRRAQTQQVQRPTAQPLRRSLRDRLRGNDSSAP